MPQDHHKQELNLSLEQHCSANKTNNLYFFLISDISHGRTNVKPNKTPRIPKPIKINGQ